MNARLVVSDSVSTAVPGTTESGSWRAGLTGRRADRHASRRTSCCPPRRWARSTWAEAGSRPCSARAVSRSVPRERRRGPIRCSRRGSSHGPLPAKAASSRSAYPTRPSTGMWRSTASAAPWSRLAAPCRRRCPDGLSMEEHRCGPRDTDARRRRVREVDKHLPPRLRLP